MTIVPNDGFVCFGLCSYVALNTTVIIKMACVLFTVRDYAQRNLNLLNADNNYRESYYTLKSNVKFGLKSYFLML